MASKVKVYSCKCHGRLYRVCPACGCQHCPDYWTACPRCLRRKHGALAALKAIRDPAIRRRAIRATELIGAPSRALADRETSGR